MDSLILLMLLLLPLASGVAIPLLPPTLARPAALVMAGAQLAMGLLIALGGKDLSTFVIQQSWLPQLGLALDLGLDGVSLPLLLLASALTAMAVLATPVNQ
jgi:NAD(P)H-quinone oxidoreductase subunit 4